MNELKVYVKGLTDNITVVNKYITNGTELTIKDNHPLYNKLSKGYTLIKSINNENKFIAPEGIYIFTTKHKSFTEMYIGIFLYINEENNQHYCVECRKYDTLEIVDLEEFEIDFYRDATEEECNRFYYGD